MVKACIHGLTGLHLQGHSTGTIRKVMAHSSLQTETSLRQVKTGEGGGPACTRSPMGPHSQGHSTGITRKVTRIFQFANGNKFEASKDMGGGSGGPACTRGPMGLHLQGHSTGTIRKVTAYSNLQTETSLRQVKTREALTWEGRTDHERAKCFPISMSYSVCLNVVTGTD